MMDNIVLEKIKVTELEEPMRCIDWLIGKFQLYPTRSSLKKVIKRGEIFINGEPATTGKWIHVGDSIELLDSLRRLPKAIDIRIPILYEDDFIIVVNKPPGLLTSGNNYDTLVNAMIGKGTLSTRPDAWEWYRPLHRLDRSTGGLVLMSKTRAAHRELAEQFERREVDKIYQAIVKGSSPEEGNIDSKVCGKVANTTFKTLQKVNSVKSEKLSLLELRPKTGRTHQLRIHCAEIGYPILGDKLYDDVKKTLSHKGLFLVATGLKFFHPATNERVSIQIDTPSKFIALLEREKRWYDRVHKN